MRTVRSEPCIRKVNRETIQRQRGQVSTGSGNSGERGEGPGHALFCAPQPGSEEGHLAPGILGKGALLRVQILGCKLHEASRARVPAGPSGFAFIEASRRWRAEASFRWRAGRQTPRWAIGRALRMIDLTRSKTSSTPRNPTAPSARDCPSTPRKDRTRYAHARWRIRRTDRPFRKGLPIMQPAAAWRRKGWTETESRQGIVQ